MQELIAIFDEGPEGRAKAHEKLEEVLAEGKFPAAECREDHGALIYAVWSEPQPERPKE